MPAHHNNEEQKMSNGELKKQLNIKACKFSKYGGKWVSMQQAKRILDDVKNEAPHFYFPHEPEKYPMDALLKMIREYEFWFKKWFGE